MPIKRRKIKVRQDISNNLAKDCNHSGSNFVKGGVCFKAVDFESTKNQFK